MNEIEACQLCPPSRERVVAIIPTLDEDAAIASVISRIPREWIGHIIVADGGSRDKTTQVAREAGAEVIVAGPGYGRACLAGALRAAQAEILVFLDGDGADDLQAIGRLVEPILSGNWDFVIGSRARGKRAPGSMAWHQLLAGRLAGLGVRVLYGVRYTDMCAFRAIRRDALLALGMRERTYGWNLEMQMRAAAAGLRILEIPVDYDCRRGGKSKVAGTFSGSARASARIIVTFTRLALRTQRNPRLAPYGAQAAGAAKARSRY
jgi:glycosyltransferase involved in cell wall biosynthesis